MGPRGPVRFEETTIGWFKHLEYANFGNVIDFAILRAQSATRQRHFWDAAF